MKSIKHSRAAVVVIMLVFAVCISAAFSVNAQNVVGSHGGEHGVDNGVETIPAGAGASSDVNITLDKVSHRYAVDIEFSSMDIAASALVWDVNNLKYVSVSGGDEVADKTYDITVTNYSDLAVKMTGSTTVEAFASNAGISIDMDASNATVIDAVTPVPGGAGVAVQATLNVNVTSSDWNTSIATIMNGGNSGTIKIGTVTVSLAAADGT